MGGDEFAIVQVALSQVVDATSLAQRVIAALSEPYEIDGHQVVIGTSVGITLAPSDGLIREQLIRNGDLALYRAKGDGRGTFRFFEAGMEVQMQARRTLEQDLRKASSPAAASARRRPLAHTLAAMPSQAAPEAPTAAPTLPTFAIPATAMPVLHRLDQGIDA